MLEIRLAIFEALSLKDKRSVVKSLKDRVAAKFNVSIAEVDDLDHWKSATLGVAMVANERRFVQSQLDLVLKTIRSDPRASIVSTQVDFWS